MRYLLLAITLACLGCQQRSEFTNADYAVEATAASETAADAAIPPEEQIDSDAEAAQAAADAAVAAANAAVLAADEPVSDSLTFHGDPCTFDCSGHEAGYQWAEDNGIEVPDDCGGNSQSFIEGCESYAEEHQEESGAREEEDESEDEF